MNLILCKLIGCFLLVAASTSSLLAQTHWIEVEAAPTADIESITGIIFSDTASYQTTEARLSSSDAQRSIIAIPYSAEIRAQQELYAFAIVKTVTGEVLYSNVKATLPDIDRASGFAQSQCEASEIPASMQSELALVANLQKIRSKRRANIRQQLDKKLSGEFLEKMRRYETGFGLHYANELSPDLPAAELVDRLNRIYHTVKKFSGK